MTTKTEINENHDSLSQDARELVLFADNHKHLHNTSAKPILKNLDRKMKKGTYNDKLATKLWGYHADRAAQAYHQEFGGNDQPWHKMFPKATRKEAAEHWEKYHRENLSEATNEDLGQLVDFVATKKPSNFAAKFNEIMQDRITDLIDNAKPVVAANLFKKE